MFKFFVGLFMILAAAIAIAYIVVNGPRPVSGGVVQPVVAVTQIVPVQQQSQGVYVLPLPTIPASVPVNVMATPVISVIDPAPVVAPAEVQRGGWEAPTPAGQLGTHDPGTNHRRTP